MLWQSCDSHIQCVDKKKKTKKNHKNCINNDHKLNKGFHDMGRILPLGWRELKFFCQPKKNSCMHIQVGSKKREKKIKVPHKRAMQTSNHFFHFWAGLFLRQGFPLKRIFSYLHVLPCHIIAVWRCLCSSVHCGFL